MKLNKIAAVISSLLALNCGMTYAATDPYTYAWSAAGDNISGSGRTISGSGNAGTAGFVIFESGKLTISNSSFNQTANGNNYNIDLSNTDTLIGNQTVDITASTFNSASNSFNIGGFGKLGTPSTFNLTDSQVSAAGSVFTSGDTALTAANANINVTDSTLSGTAILDNQSGIMNLNAQSSVLSGDIISQGTEQETATSSLSLNNSSQWSGNAQTNTYGNTAISLASDSSWNVTGDSVVNTLDVNDSSVDLSGGGIASDTLTGTNGTLISSYNNTTGSYNKLTAGSASGSFTVGIHSSGTDTGLNGSDIVNVTDNSATFTGLTSDNGAWKYDAVTQNNSDGSTSVVMQKTSQLSTGANAALSAASAGVNVWNLELDTLNQRLNASRRNPDDQGGVWASYFGGENHTTTDANASYQQNTNGVMVGTDSLFNANNGHWLVGAAMSQGRSDLSMTGASGDLDSTGAQVYLSRRYNNGVFVDTTAKFEHFSNSQNVTSSDGARSDSSYSNNGYGVSLKGGYTYDGGSYFIEPYIKGSAMTLTGVDYTTSNGMQVNNNDYNSLQLEAGSDFGTSYNFSHGAMVKPYLHLAIVNELSNGNSVNINGEQFSDSIDGSAIQTGAGAQVQLSGALGAYANINYTQGHAVDNPWQTNVGISYSW